MKSIGEIMARSTTSYSVKIINKHKLDNIARLKGIKRMEVIDILLKEWLQNQDDNTIKLLNTLESIKEESD